MRKLFFIPLLGLLLVGCGSNQPSGDTPKEVLPTSISVSPNSIDLLANTNSNLNDLITLSFEPSDTTNKSVSFTTESNLFSINGTTISTGGVEGTGTVKITSLANSEVFANLTVNISEPEPEAYTVTYTCSEDYTVIGLKDSYVENESVSFTIEVTNETKEVSEVKADNIAITPVDGTYSFTMPSYNVTIDITLVNKTIPVTDTSIKYNISYDMGTRKTSYAFKNDEADLIKETFTVDGDKTNIINSVSSFEYIYGGGYGGSGDNAWLTGDVLKFGTTSVNGYLVLELSRPINLVTITGMVSANTCIVSVGDPANGENTKTVTCSDMAIANKETVTNQSYTSFGVELEPTSSIKIDTTNKKVLYISSIELFYGEAKTYTVNWYNYDRTLLETDLNVPEGSVPEYNGATPKRDGHIFTGWNPEVTKIYKDTDYVATFAEEGETYTVTWENYDHQELEVDRNVPKGTTPSYDGNTPTREPDEDYNYTFNGWNPDITPVTEDVTYTAKYIARSKEEKIPGVDPVISADNKTVEYGFYPQTHVKEANVVTELEKLSPINSKGWVMYNDEYYARATANVYNNESYVFADGVSITNGNEYWFKCETIKWTITSNENNKYTLVANSLLDAHNFYKDYSYRTINGSIIYPNNYKESDIRTWLNGEFLNTAFFMENSNLLVTEVDNSGVTTGDSNNKYVCDNTNDKIYLPSCQEVNAMQSKTAITSDYARAVGAWSNTKGASYKYNGSYWTRSPSSDFSYAVWNVNSGGVLSEYAVDGGSHSVRPCITIQF